MKENFSEGYSINLDSLRNKKEVSLTFSKGEKITYGVRCIDLPPGESRIPGEKFGANFLFDTGKAHSPFAYFSKKEFQYPTDVGLIRGCFSVNKFPIFYPPGKEWGILFHSWKIEEKVT